jgi:ATP/maltotriose-dependent transcriptional regulator MalT
MRPDATAAEIADLALRAARQVDVVGDDGLMGTALSAVLLGLRWSDRLNAAERILDAAISHAQRAGSLPYFAIASGHRALVRRRRGRLREAEADARAVLDSDAVGVPWQATGATTALVLCQLDAGRLDEAWRTLAGAALDGHLPDRPVFMAMLLARMQVHAARGDGARALEDYREALRRRRSLGGVTASWIGDGLRAAEVHDALGDRDAALALADEMLVLARRWDTPGAIGQALRTHARLGAGGDSIQTLQEAIALLERSPARLEHARALVDLGGALRRRGYRRDARHPLRSGYQLARECGADALAEYARTELQASGVRLRREALRGADSLTPSERRIAEMAASGASNVEIAQALFVTLKTVEMHLTHTYRKLEITKRAELPEALADAGDQPA